MTVLAEQVVQQNTSAAALVASPFDSRPVCARPHLDAPAVAKRKAAEPQRRGSRRLRGPGPMPAAASEPPPRFIFVNAPDASDAVLFLKLDGPASLQL